MKRNASPPPGDMGNADHKSPTANRKMHANTSPGRPFILGKAMRDATKCEVAVGVKTAAPDDMKHGPALRKA